MHHRIAATIAIAAVLTGTAASAQTPVPVTTPAPVRGPLALDARNLRDTRTAAGYRLAGQALVKDACAGARFAQFLGNIFPPQFNLVQYRRPGTVGLLCIQRLTWVTAQPLIVTSVAPPRYVTVHTQKAYTKVPIRPGP